MGGFPSKKHALPWYPPTLALEEYGPLFAGGLGRAV